MVATENRLYRCWEALRRRAGLIALMLPTLLGLALFAYYPSFSTIQHAFYNWDGQITEEFIGVKNFIEAFTADPLFWRTFALVGVLLLANALKMWPSILTAIVLHRIRSERFQYIYRVLFVLPMVIPGLVMLLVWKSFFDPTTGLLNPLLRSTGLMGLLARLDQIMPHMAQRLAPVFSGVIQPVFGSSLGMVLVGVLLWNVLAGWESVRKNPWRWAIFMLISFPILGIPRGIISLLSVWTLGEIARRFQAEAALRWCATLLILAAAALVVLGGIWTVPTYAFDQGSPAWLGHSRLVIPAVIFWGFPWIGTVGVLIYLAGLQNIPTDVYEAGSLDGLSSFGKLRHIELPLILTQVRINLIFMTMGTLGDYGSLLMLLGPEGGPGSVGMVPGLYMYRVAFVESRFGYACALGLVMFAITLAITMFYQRYVKVDK